MKEEMNISVYIGATDTLEGERPWYAFANEGALDGSRGYIKVATVPITFERPTKKAFVDKQVLALRNEILEVNKAHCERVSRIEQTINSLLAIEYDDGEDA